MKQDANDKRKQLIYRTKKLEKLSQQYFQKDFADAPDRLAFIDSVNGVRVK